MGRYTGPACRLCRREGMKICDKHKCATVKRNYPPGMHGKESGSKKSDYAKQLREKQKTRRIFGVSEKQIQKYYRRATASPLESGQELLRQFEQRLDNAVFRCGFASTRRQARQLVTHGIFSLNGHRVNIPSLHLKEGDTFTVRPKNKSMPLFGDFEKKKTMVPGWLKVDGAVLSGQVIGKPTKEHLEASIDPQMIIEFYSR
ncbi:30S ribosomal protein S4 [Candidatus Peregrinibacteria bacterium]|nr:30S ribosomal protein S4 [Candidatus Peregrinibacteria bacterium]